MTLPDILELLLILILPLILVSKWRGFGALVAVPLGWATVYGLLKCFPYNRMWKELEDWPGFGWLVMSIWSVFVYGSFHSGRELERGDRVMFETSTPKSDYGDRWAYSRFMAWPIVHVRFDQSNRFTKSDYDY